MNFIITFIEKNSSYWIPKYRKRQIEKSWTLSWYFSCFGFVIPVAILLGHRTTLPGKDISFIKIYKSLSSNGLKYPKSYSEWLYLNFYFLDLSTCQTTVHRHYCSPTHTHPISPLFRVPLWSNWLFFINQVYKKKLLAQIHILFLNSPFPTLLNCILVTLLTDGWH